MFILNKSEVSGSPSIKNNWNEGKCVCLCVCTYLCVCARRQTDDTVPGRQLQTVTEQEIQSGLIVFSYDWHTHTQKQTLMEVWKFCILFLNQFCTSCFWRRKCAPDIWRGPSVDLLLVLVVPDCCVYVWACRAYVSKAAKLKLVKSAWNKPSLALFSVSCWTELERWDSYVCELDTQKN